MTKLDDTVTDAVSRMLVGFDDLEWKDKKVVLDLAIKWATHLSKKGGKGKFGEGLDDETEE